MSLNSRNKGVRGTEEWKDILGIIEISILHSLMILSMAQYHILWGSLQKGVVLVYGDK